ncbi:MAG TPA: hypothetical protein VG711_05300 [Phycisphaerales bacterium]|nr:hypothetical protein [Phycisphaerales bacterium]
MAKTTVSAPGADDDDQRRTEHLLRFVLGGPGRGHSSSGDLPIQGRIGVKIRDGRACIIEVRCETDFTARTPDFGKLIDDLLDICLEQEPGPIVLNQRILDRIDEAHRRCGEHISLIRGELLRGERFGSYLHHDWRLGVLVQVEGGSIDGETLTGLCIHVAAHLPPPLVVSPEDIAKLVGMQTKRKDAEEVTLLNQLYVKDPSGKNRVKDVLPKGVKILKFVRYLLGE